MEINWLSFIIATLTPTIVGFVYYHKAVFGSAWMQSIGMTEEKMQSANMTKVLSIAILVSALIAFFLLNFCNGPCQEAEFDSFKHGATHGAIISVFLILPILVTNGLYEQRSWKGVFIGFGYWIITLALMGGILDAMHHWPN